MIDVGPIVHFRVRWQTFTGWSEWVICSRRPSIHDGGIVIVYLMDGTERWLTPRSTFGEIQVQTIRSDE